MKFSFCMFVVLILSSASFAGNKNFSQAMERALTVHDTASSFASEKIALQEFEAVCQKFR